MEIFLDFLRQYLGSDLNAAFIIILNLILIESLLSVDNAAVLATMVMDLPEEQRKKALKYGIIGAYVFRGLSLLFASWLIKIWWLKPLGGLYLLYLAISYFNKKEESEEDALNKERSPFYRYTVGLFGNFWATVILVEIMDLAFSIDNVFAAVAYTRNIYLICIGVFIGILSMRFVAQGFVKLMERYPFLEKAAFSVIAILGIKLCIDMPCHFLTYRTNVFCTFLQSEKADLYVSIITAAVFLLPILTSILFKWPSGSKKFNKN